MLLGIIDILHFLVLGFRLYSVWELPINSRPRHFLFEKRMTYDVRWGLLIFCVAVLMVWDSSDTEEVPYLLQAATFVVSKVHDSYVGDFGYIIIDSLVYDIVI